MSTPPPRLHIIMARRTPRAVILRRGPAGWYHVIAWNTGKDTFEHGAWFKGRIYEDRCDLSPDGELLLYFALKGSRWSTSYAGTWTAVSRLPWLYALTLWPQGDTWGGGGQFVDDRHVVLQTGSLSTHPDHIALGLEVSLGPKRAGSISGCVDGAEWSGYDQVGYVVFTLGGKLYRRLKTGDRELADFNDLTPAPEEAPGWAKRLLPPLDTDVRWRRRNTAHLKRRKRNRGPRDG